MSATFREREIGDVTVVDVKGRITLGGGSASDLRETVKSLIKQGRTKIVLNLHETVYVDSCGIAELVSGFTALSNHGGGLKLLGLTKGIRDLLQITKLYTVFEVFGDEAEAVRSFS